jgi:hypothetical protein
LQPCLGLELRINLSGTTTAAVISAGEFVRVRAGFARRRRQNAKLQNKAM